MTLKNLTVRLLKDLARKHLGTSTPEGRLHEPAQPRAAPRRAQEVEEPPPAAPERIPGRAIAERAAHTLAAIEPPPEPTPAEPVVEGFFVARVQGEDEVRRHHLAEHPVGPTATGPNPRWIEHLPEIPRVYEDDRVVLLARDPATAMLYWDISEQTRNFAFEGLRDPRVVLRVFEFGREVRTLDVALESLGWYVTGLSPGRTYRMELHAVSSDHISRRIAQPSNTVTLPSDEVSSDTTVRFMRVDWDAPLNRMREHLQTGRARIQTPEHVPEALEIVHRRWVPMPTSGSWQLVESVERITRVRAPGVPQEENLGFGSWNIGGSSSFTMSSWVFSGASRAPTDEGKGS